MPRNKFIQDWVPTGEIGFCPTCGKHVVVKVLPEDRLQKRVVAAVVRRGYRDGWTPAQFLARQMLKLCEEFGEAYEIVDRAVIPIAFGISALIWECGCRARKAFDLPQESWEYTPAGNDDPRALAALRLELVDMQVVLCNAAEALSELTGEEIDLMKEAAEKAEADVERGVR